MGYRFNCLDELVFMAKPFVSKPLLTEFCIHHRLESCDLNQPPEPVKPTKPSLSVKPPPSNQTILTSLTEKLILSNGSKKIAGF